MKVENLSAGSMRLTLLPVFIYAGNEQADTLTCSPGGSPLGPEKLAECFYDILLFIPLLKSYIVVLCFKSVVIKVTEVYCIEGMYKTGC